MLAHLHHFRELPSTQTHLLSCLQTDDLPQHTIFWADKQTGGYGKGNSQWESQAGSNLTFSWLLHPHFLQPKDSFLLTQAVALGIADYLSAFHKPVFVKWPNDIWVEQSKICGFLIDTHLVGNTFRYAVCGIGININQTEFNPLIPHATSLAKLTGRSHDPCRCLEQLMQCLKQRYCQLCRGEYSVIQHEYHQKLYLRDRPAQFLYRNTPIEATIQGVTPYGWLVLRKNNHEEIIADLEEIKLVVP